MWRREIPSGFESPDKALGKEEQHKQCAGGQDGTLFPLGAPGEAVEPQDEHRDQTNNQAVHNRKPSCRRGGQQIAFAKRPAGTSES